MIEAVRLLSALRLAGCDVFIDPEDDNLFCSPPLRGVDWDDDVEEAIDEFYWDLKEIVEAEHLIACIDAEHLIACIVRRIHKDQTWRNV